MANENETLADIVADFREMVHQSADGIIAVKADVIADRIEAARKREISQSWHHREMEELILRHEKEVAELKKLIPQPDPDWKAICEKCHDGDIEPDCEYYGEPNGCNSPIYGEHPKAKPIGNAAATREALEAMNRIDTRGLKRLLCELVEADIFDGGQINKTISAVEKARCALSAPPRKGKWKNGRRYEYEYAYCSECGRMQWAGWDTHKQAEENIESFACDYKYCPGCGAEMEGGVYVK